MGQKDLHKAREAKQDEFYTQMDDITAELKHYREYFRGKVVFCNCDDPYESHFFKYFALNFNSLGLKKLIATCYDGSPVMGNELPLQFDTPDSEPRKIAYKIEITEVDDFNGDGAVNLADVAYLLQNDKNVLSRLHGDAICGEDGKMYGPGDFRCQECVELLKQADIVCTNPPFSLFREYLSQLVKFNKRFIIIGNTNALKYKECFQLFMDDRIRTGYTKFNVGMFFYVPNTFEKYHHIEEGKKIARVSTSCWFTNLPVTRHKEDLIMYKSYNPKDYPKFDNYDAINVNTYTDIPMDYTGIMGVPITFLDKYNPTQFEIVGCSDRGGDNRPEINAIRLTEKPEDSPKINGKKLFTRVFIRRKN